MSLSEIHSCQTFSHSEIKVMELNCLKIWALEPTYRFKKVLIILYRPPTGISVWYNSPRFPLPRRPPSALTVCGA